MSDIKCVITLLCKHLKLLFNVNVKPEHFRLSKFNKNDDNCVLQMWELLFKICRQIYPRISDDNVVSFVKLSFAMMNYKSIEFYSLPLDMSAGSRELLLALGWLLLKENVLEMCTSRILEKSPLHMEFGTDMNKETGVSKSNILKIGSLESNLNSILLIAGKIKHNVNAIAEVDQSRITYTTKVHKASIDLCGLPHLSVKETKFVKNPEMLPEYLIRVSENVILIETHKEWFKKCHIFWNWMESVVIEKDCGAKLDHQSVQQKKILFSVLDTMRLRTKACMLQNQRSRNINNVSKNCDNKVPAPVSDSHLLSVQGLPRCIYQAKGKNTEMEQLLINSEMQLKEVSDIFKVKKAAVLSHIYECAGQMQNVVVLFPNILKQV